LIIHARDESVEAIHGLSQRIETGFGQGVIGHDATLRVGPTSRVLPSHYGARNLNFRTLLVAVRAIASATSIDVGHL
jgi:hypothetical protein